MTQHRRYVVTLKRDKVYPAWIVQQNWPHGIVEGHHFYDHNLKDQRYHQYFEDCCKAAPKDYVLEDIQITEDKGMIATYRQATAIDC